MVRIVGTTFLVAAAAISAVVVAAGKQDARPCECGDPICDGCVAEPPPDRHAQSGYGLCVAPWATLTYGPKYKSYYVGGSARPRAWDPRVAPEPRFPWEGTWGTDYVPALTGAELWWTHGRLDQDGGGQYEPDRKNLPLFLRFGK